MGDGARRGGERFHDVRANAQIASEIQGERPVPSFARHGERAGEEGIGPLLESVQEIIVFPDERVEVLAHTARLGPRDVEQLRG